MLGLLLSLTTPALADCPATFQQVMATSEQAVVAYEQANASKFETAYRDLRTELDCLEAVLEPAEVRTLHLVRALAAWTQGDADGTRAALGSVAALDPEFDLRTEVAVYDAGLIALAEETLDAPPMVTTITLPVVPWSTWRVDGQDGADTGGLTPVGRPVLLQLINSNTGQMRSFYLEQGGLPEGFETPESAGLLAWSRESSKPRDDQESSTPKEPRTPRERQAGGLHRPLALAGGAAAVLGAAGLGLAWYKKTTFEDCVNQLTVGGTCDRTRDDLELDYTVNRAAGLSGYGLVGVAGVLGIGAVVTWRF